MTSDIIIQDELALKAYAEVIAKRCSDEYCIALHGSLGVGKTTFVKYLGKLWNIQDVRSTSFDILNVHDGQRRLIHMDAYRLKNGDITDFAIDDLCRPPFCFVVEWPECLTTPIPFNLHLTFTILPDLSRHILSEEV